MNCTIRVDQGQSPREFNVRHHGVESLRAVRFEPMKDGKHFLGQGGQSSPQLVQRSNPPKSWTMHPLGEREHRTSKHWDDHSEKLFSPGKMKPAYFLDKEELLRHVESTKVLKRELK